MNSKPNSATRPVISDDAKHEFLKDVTAMANAYGGTIVYGIQEDADGAAEKLVPFALKGADEIANKIDHVLTDGVDEKIIGVHHAPIRITGKKWCWVVRIPASHLAPHMITMKTPRPRFYRRYNRTNVPLDARGIKEVAVGAQWAEARAAEIIQERLGQLVERGRRLFPDARREGNADAELERAQLVLHLLPLFPKRFDPEDIVARARSLGSLRYALEGLYFEVRGGGQRFESHVLFIRNGGVEFQRHRIMYRHELGQIIVAQESVIREMAAWLRQARKLCELGVVELPGIMTAAVLDASNTYMPSEYGLPVHPSERERVSTEAFVLTDWGPRSRQEVKQMMDTIWQAYGFPSANVNKVLPWEAHIWGTEVG